MRKTGMKRNDIEKPSGAERQKKNSDAAEERRAKEKNGILLLLFFYDFHLFPLHFILIAVFIVHKCLCVHAPESPDSVSAHEQPVLRSFQ